LREEGSGTREIINQLLIPYLHHLRPGIEFGNPEAIKRAAASGLGITCLSRFVVDDLLKIGSPGGTAYRAAAAHATLLPGDARAEKAHPGLDMLIDHLVH
jgi:DNA-binding transcriptional LysR family regulator